MNSLPATLTHEEVEYLLRKFLESNFGDISRRQKTFSTSAASDGKSIKISYALTQRDYRTNKYKTGEILVSSTDLIKRKYRFATVPELEDILSSILTILTSTDKTQLPLL